MSHTSFGWLRPRAAALFVFAALAFLPCIAQAQTLQTLTIYGTDAAPGTIDPNTDCSKDGDVTWLPAYALTPLHPWQTQYPIPGTTRWIGRTADGQSAPATTQFNPEVLDFRIRFYAPSDISSPSMTFVLDPDNFGDIYLNGTKINSQQVTGPSVQTFTVSSANIQPGLNTIIVRLTDWGGWLGMNYSVTVQGYGSTPFQRLIAPPSPTNVSSTLADGLYKGGSNIPIQVTFNRAVTVTGTPTLTLETGSTDRVANYASGSGTNVLTFSYAAQIGDSSSDLDYISSAALSLNGGSIKAAAADLQDANLALPSPGTTGSLGFNKAIVVDGILPVATLTSSAANSTNVSPIPVTITFSEPVTGLTASDFIVTNGTVNSLTGSGASYSATILPSASPVSVSVFLASNVVQDLAGNPNPASNSVTRTYDVNPPTVALSSTAPSVTNASIPVTFAFSEVVTGFTASDVTVTNGNVTNFSGSGVIYNATIIPSADGPVTAKVSSGVAQDLAGNGNQLSSTLSWTYDHTAPTVAVTSTAAAKTKSAIPVTITFSEPVTGFTASDISVSNGTVSGLGGSGTTYAATITPAANGTVSVSIPANGAQDSAGNNNTASSTLTRIYDNVAPVLTVPASPVAATATNASGTAVTFTVTANDAIDGSITPVLSAASGSVFAPGSTIVTATATDAAGNTATATFTVTVRYLNLTEDKTAVTIPQGGTATNSGTFAEVSGEAVSLTPSTGTLTQTGSGQWTYQQSLTEGNHPIELVLDTAENLYVANEANTVYKYDAGGNLVKTWTVTGDPKGIAIDNVNHWVYVTSNGEGQIYKFDLNGNKLATFGSGRFVGLHCVAVDAAGNVYATDPGQNNVQVFDSNGNYLRQWGTSGSGDGQFSFVQGIRITSSGTVYVADRGNNRIQYFNANGTFLGKWGSGGSGNGQFNQPASVGIDPSGNVYVGDISNNRVQKFTATGAYLDQFGPGSGPGALAFPHGTAFPPAGRSVYIASWSSGVVQKYLTPGAWSWTYAAAANAPIGTSTVTVNAVSTGGATASTSFSLTITDATPPVLTLPANIAVAATGAAGATVNFTANATDNVDGALPVTLSMASGSTFALGTTTVNATATDAAGNKATGSFTVTVNPALATITLTTPTFTYDGTAKSASATTSPAGLPVSFTYNGGNVTAPTNAATYDVTATVNQSWVTGSTTGTLTINPASETIFFNNTTQTYDGTPRIVTVATNPNGVAASSVVVTYDGSTTPPTNAGSYNVQGTFNNPNYTGTNSTTLLVKQASASVALTNNIQFYDGTPKAMTVTTTPAGLTTTVTYNGSPTPPTAVGTYTVFAVVHDQNYAGTGNGVLQIRDNQAPVLSLPGNIAVEATSLPGTTVTFSGSATDNVDGTVAVTFTPASGSAFPLGSTTVNATAKDAAGNTAHGSFTVTVQDTTKPALQLPADLAVDATSASGAVVNFEATATDAVGIAVVKDDFETTPAYNANTHNYVVFGGSPTTANGWVFSGYGGYLNGNGGGFGSVTQFDGQQCAFVQSVFGIQSSLATAKTVRLYAGATYYVSFAERTRPGYPAVTYDVTLNGASGSTEIFRRDAAAGEGWARYLATFVATTTGDYTLSFNNLTTGTDATVFFDDVAFIGTKVAVDTTPASGSTFALGTTPVNASIVDFASNPQSGSFSVTVNQAVATISLSAPTYVYDGSVKPMLATTEPAGLPVTLVYDDGATRGEPVNAGTHTVLAQVSLPWIAGSANGSYVIAKANATIAVEPYSVTYDGNVHTSTGGAKGVDGGALAGLDLSGTAHTNAGAYRDTWTFTDVTGNYNDTSARVENAIAQATPTISVTPYSVTYDGSAHVATGLVTGAKGEVLAGLALGGTTHTNAGTYLDGWTFGDVTGNYTNASGTVSDAIAKAAASVSVTAYSVTYDGNAHGATGNAKGVSGEILAGLDLSATTHTAAGSYGDKWTFTDATGNYNNASATITDSIAKAAATIAVTPYNVTYDTQAHTATGSATGVKGEALVGLNLTHTTHTDAGTYTDAWTFNDITGNYDVATASVTDKIAKAPATITLAGLAQQYDGTPQSVTATTAPANLKVDITYAGNLAAPTLPGSYAVVATINDPNYTGSTTGTLAIGATALIRHGITIDGDVDGSIQVLTAEASTLNGNAGITGDLLVPGTPTVRLNGHPTYGGTLDSTGASTPTNYTVTLNGNALLRHLVRHVDPIAMPTVAAPATPTGTRSVNLNKSTDPIGAWATLKDLTLNGNVGNVAVPAGVYGNLTANGNSSFTFGVAGATTPSVYELQSLTLNGNVALNVVGPVIVIVKNGLNVNGTTGNGGHPEWLALRVANGGVTLNGNVTFNGDITAPSGTVTINGNSTLNGRVTADRLTVNGNSQLVEPDHP